MYRLGILCLIVSFLGCGGGTSSQNRESPDRSATISFQLTFAQPPGQHAQTRIDHAIGEPDICRDYAIETIAVSVYQTQDNAEAASAEGACTDHSLTVNSVPAGQSLYVVCKGLIGPNTAWQGRRDGIVAIADQTTDIGTIEMQYIGDDTTGPEIASIFPTSDATSVDLSASIMVVFDEPLSPATIPEQAIVVQSNDDTPVPGRVDYDPDIYTLRFTPAAENGFDPETTYAVTLQSYDDASNTITDFAGNSLSDEITWQFTTRSEDDFTAPQVIATSPAHLATNVDRQASISAFFSEPMDPESLTNSVFQISSDDGMVSGQTTYDDQARKLTIIPDSDLNNATMYTAVISTEAKDLAQNAAEEHYVWQFCTSGSYIIHTSVIPKSGSGGSIHPEIASVNQGDNHSFDIEVNPYYSLLKLFVDGVSVTPEPSYTFYDVSENHTIRAEFRCDWLLSENPVSKFSFPQTKGGRAVWYGQGESKTDIFYYHYDNVQKKYIVENITETLPGNHYDPQINSDGHLVWSGNKDGKSDIYYYDGSYIKNITRNENLPGLQSSPQINDSGHLVWYAGNYDVYYYNGKDVINLSEQSTNRAIASRKNITIGEIITICNPAPKINNKGDMVWTACNYDLYYYDGSDGTSAPIPNTPNQNFGHEINADGDVVWMGEQDFGLASSIYFYDKETRAAKIISDNLITFNSGPQINDEGHVVWSGHNPSYENNIYYYNGKSRENITEGTNGNHQSPQLNNSGYIVWRCTYNSKQDIYYYDKERDIKVNATNNLIGIFRNPQLVGNRRIIWQGYNGDDYGIYSRYFPDFATP